MAKGDFYNAQEYAWQLRELEDGRVFIRYDHQVSTTNKGRYNTSPIIKVETKNGLIRFTTQSGSQYVFRVDKVAKPMHLIALAMKFGVEF